MILTFAVENQHSTRYVPELLLTYFTTCLLISDYFQSNLHYLNKCAFYHNFLQVAIACKIISENNQPILIPINQQLIRCLILVNLFFSHSNSYPNEVAFFYN